MKILGQYDPDVDKTRKEKYNNSIVAFLLKQKNTPNNIRDVKNPQVISEAELHLSPTIVTVLNDIRLQDNDFNLDKFLSGAKKAYTMTVQAITDKDKETLDFLLESDLYAQIIKQDATSIVESINSITLIDAVLYGDRAIITVMIAALQNDGEKQSKVTFTRYLSQDNSWKISKLT